jgi:hypothetical protein
MTYDSSFLGFWVEKKFNLKIYIWVNQKFYRALKMGLMSN